MNIFLLINNSIYLIINVFKFLLVLGIEKKDEVIFNKNLN